MDYRRISAQSNRSHKTEDDENDDSPKMKRVHTLTTLISLEQNEECTRQAKKGKKSKTQTASSPRLAIVLKLKSPILAYNCFATILEDAITEIRILGECNNKMRMYKMEVDMEQLLRDKYGVVSTELDDYQSVDPRNLETAHHKIMKLERDRNFCKDVLTSTYLDIVLNHKYDPLILSREEFESRNDYLMSLKENEMQNKILNRQLNRKLRHQRNKIKSAVYESHSIEDNLQHEVDDLSIVEAVRGRYIQSWENSRSEQQAISIKEVEVAQADTINYYRRKTEGELRVHMELELINNLRMEDILKDIDKWMAKYDTDIEAVDVQIQSRITDVNQQRKMRLELEQKLAHREEEMNEWKQFKTDRENLRLHKIKMNEAALAVQSWWRGILVRLELGPYKPSKHLRKPAKTDKKKKK